MTTKCELSDLPKPKMWPEVKEASVTFSYHYLRLFREIRKDVQRWARKPATGKRYVVDLTAHQEMFLRQPKKI